jgi:hypothetical protein
MLNIGSLTLIRFFGKEKAAEKRTMISHDPIAQFGHPNQRRPRQRAHQPARIANLFQHKHRSPAGFNDAPLSRDNVDGLLTRRVELRRHRRPGALLVGNGVKFVINILAPDPGDRAASEASIAVPQEPVLVRLNGAHLFSNFLQFPMHKAHRLSVRFTN